jgi:hypothetical protein
VGLSVALKGKGLESSADQTSWKALKGRQDGEWFEADLAMDGKPVFVRRTP